MNKKKNIFVVIGLIFCVLILSLLIVVLINNSSLKEKDVVSSLTNMGEEIYTTYYYPELLKQTTQEEFSEYLKGFKDIGLKFDLNQLSKYSEEFKKEIEKFKTCDKNNTMVIIYPTSPYLNTDFSTQVKLDCKFKK